MDAEPAHDTGRRNGIVYTNLHSKPCRIAAGDAHRCGAQDAAVAGLEHADRPIVRVGHVDMANSGCHCNGPGSMAHGNRRDEAAVAGVEHADRTLAPVGDEDAIRTRIDRCVGWDTADQRRRYNRPVARIQHADAAEIGHERSARPRVEHHRRGQHTPRA